MDIKEIFNHAKGKLSHAEKEFYLGCCALSDDAGACSQTVAAVAELVGILPQSASRLFKKLVAVNFLRKQKGGFLCLVGFGETKHDVNSTKHGVNFSAPETPTETKHDVNSTKHGVNSTKHGVNSHIRNGIKSNTNAACLEIFVYWQNAHDRHTDPLTVKQTFKIEERLKTFPLEKLKQAVDGAKYDDWLMGRDKNSIRPFNELETILRDDEQVKRLIGLYEANHKPPAEFMSIEEKQAKFATQHYNRPKPQIYIN